MIWNADRRRAAELHALIFHLCNPAIDQTLIQLEVRDAVAEQAAGAFVLFKHRDGVAHASQLLRTGESRRTAAYDRDRLIFVLLGRLWFDPALIPGIRDNGALNGLNAHSSLRVIHDAAVFAQRWTDTRSELREVIG